MRRARIVVHLLSVSVRLLYRRYLWRDSPAELGGLVAGHLERLGGTFLLLGHVLSIRPDWFPAAFCGALGSLRDATPPLAPADAGEVVERELGRPVHELFSFFDKSAQSADWLGQTHLAAITENDHVVVTIRRPGLAPMVAADLSAVRVIVGLIDFLGLLGKVRLGAQFEAFRQHTLAGLSLIPEARKADRLAAQTDDNPRQYIPQVYWSHTADNVLTMERLQGTPLLDIVRAAGSAVSLATLPGRRAEAPQVDLPVVARNLLYNYLHQVLNGKYMHGNPVPGILTVLEDNAIGYRDCRDVERIDSRFTQQQMEVISAVRAGDVESLFRSLWDWVEGPNDAPVEFEDSFHRRVSEWLDLVDDRRVAPSQRNLRHLLAGILEDFRRFEIAAPPALLVYYHAFAITTLTAELLVPNMDTDSELAGFFQKMLTERIEKKIDTGTLSQTVLEYEQFLVALPHHFRELMRMVRQNQSPMVRSVDPWELRLWYTLQLLATLTILAMPAVYVWSWWTGNSPATTRLQLTGLVAGAGSLLVLRRAARIKYHQSAVGRRRMRQL